MRMLLIALATTVALFGPAAADRNQFAPEVLGLWCAQEGHNIFAPRSTSHLREDCGDADDRLILELDGTKGEEWGCIITKIRRATVPNVHGYDTEENCGGEGYEWKQKVRYVYLEGSSPAQSVLMTRVLWESRHRPERATPQHHEDFCRESARSQPPAFSDTYFLSCMK